MGNAGSASMKRRKGEVVCSLRGSMMTLRVKSKAEMLANTNTMVNTVVQREAISAQRSAPKDT